MGGRQAATDREGNRTFGYDIAGNRHLVAQRRNNQQVVTTQGRRFYAEMPQTQWVIHLPVIHRRTHYDGRYTYFRPYTIDVTHDMMVATFAIGSPQYELLQMTRTRDGADQQAQVEQMMRLWAEMFYPGSLLPSQWEYPDEDSDVEVVVDERPITYSAQYTGVSRTG